MQEVQDVWVYLSSTPLLHLTITLIAYLVATAIYQKGKLNPILNPVMLSVIALVALLTFTETSYDSYFEGAQFIHFLLGPATVALAIPLYRQFEKVRKSALAILASILSGSLAASGSAVAIAYFLDGSEQALLSLAPKSVTAPVAMGITEQLGGLPSLTAVLVISTGIIGSIFGPYLLNLMRIKDWKARGLALGTASHGIGTARAMQVNEVAGAFSGLAMGINALATAILLPILWSLFF